MDNKSAALLVFGLLVLFSFGLLVRTVYVVWNPEHDGTRKRLALNGQKK